MDIKFTINGYCVENKNFSSRECRGEIYRFARTFRLVENRPKKLFVCRNPTVEKLSGSVGKFFFVAQVHNRYFWILVADDGKMLNWSIQPTGFDKHHSSLFLCLNS